MRVVMRGRALYSMGLLASDLAGGVWDVVPCDCDLCALGRHIVIEPPRRHIARCHVRGVGELVVDELRAEDSDALSAGIARGLRQALRGAGRVGA